MKIRLPRYGNRYIIVVLFVLSALLAPTASTVHAQDLPIETAAMPGYVPLTNIQAIAAGGEHACALTTDGGVKCWGNDGFGQLGDGDGNQYIQLVPMDVVGLSSGVQAISAGELHTCALTIGGGVKCWGGNSYGQIGDDDKDSYIQYMPADVFGLSSGVQAIAAGGHHTCALTTYGGVKCWGDNSGGQVGDGSFWSKVTPVDVFGLKSGVQAIAAGGEHTCALTTGGGVKCWGRDTFGQLGDDGFVPQLVPVDVVGLSSGVQAIVAGGDHTCALTTDGGVKCWGSNDAGQIGDGNDQTPSTPVNVSGLTSGVQAIATGGNHTCALTIEGGVKCWGWGYLLSVVGVVSLNSGVQTIAAGIYDTCALTSGGGVKCWGSGYDGKGTPVDIVDLSSGVQAIAVGGSHTCALTTAGGVKCWGSDWAGQLGDGDADNDGKSTPGDVVGLSNGVQAITAGHDHTCALTTDGTVKCWGGNYAGQVGSGVADPTINMHTPVDVVGLNSGVQAISAGDRHTCALTTGGGVKCWGSDSFGQVGDGDGDNNDKYTPVDVVGLSNGVDGIATGGGHTCALTTARGVKCWGENQYGQLGDTSSYSSKYTPVDVNNWGTDVQAITAGYNHTCALTTVGSVKCSGDYFGEGVISGPFYVSGLNSGVQTIAAGYNHTCALTTDGGVRCWGSNSNGQLGDGLLWNKPVPMDVLMPVTCYALTRTKNGSGAVPAVDIDHSPGCPLDHYLANTQIILQATPDANQRVQGWSASVTGGSGDNIGVLRMPAEDMTVEVTYAACRALNLEHTGAGSDPIAAPANSFGCAADRYAAGESIIFSATPDLMHRVKAWSGTNATPDTGSQANSLTMPNAAATVSVEYEPCFELITSVSGSGDPLVVSPAFSPGCLTGSFAAGQPIVLSAAPATGWRVAGWSGTDDDSAIGKINTFTMPDSPANVSVTYMEETTASLLFLPNLWR